MNDTPTLIGVFVNWFPMLLLIGVWIYFMRQFQGKSGISQGTYLEELLNETRRHNARLEELLAKLHDRIDRID